MVQRHPHLLRRDDTVLVVVDMQEPFLRGIHDRQRLMDNVLLLVQAAPLLSVPMIVTTQYAERMGSIVPEIHRFLTETECGIINKLSFSCAGEAAFMEQLQTLGRHQIVLCGVETHICVSQTALDLIACGYQVHAAADAVSARSLEKHKLGMERLRDSGALPCASEAAVYELLQQAGTAEFKQILGLVK